MTSFQRWDGQMGWADKIFKLGLRPSMGGEQEADIKLTVRSMRCTACENS